MTTTPFSGAADMLREVNAFQAKVAAGIEKLGTIKDEQIQIATAPKEEIFRTDKVTLYRYQPQTESRFRTPMLIIYGLIGRHTMTDLQEDRSLVRNLLKQGVDLWVVDWGNPSRADRWLTIDDYVCGTSTTVLRRCVRRPGNPGWACWGFARAVSSPWPMPHWSRRGSRLSC
jgi:polyhydroxyalkanoate synthase subunit PhaC